MHLYKIINIYEICCAISRTSFFSKISSNYQIMKELLCESEKGMDKKII